MWDLSYAFPSLLLLLIYLGYYYVLPHIPTKRNLTFVSLLVIECGSVIMDIVSSWVDMHHTIYPLSIEYFTNSLYFILFFLRTYAFYSFTASVLRIDNGRNLLVQLFVRIPSVFGIVVSFFSPWLKKIYYMDEKGYHSGPWYNYIYIAAAVYLLGTYVIFFIYKSKLVRRREVAGIFWYNTILVIGVILRYMFPSLLLEDTFCLTAIVIIYLSFENPDFYLEGRTSFFNSKALKEYLGEISETKEYNMFAVVIKNYKDVREIYGAQQMALGIQMIGNYLQKRYPGSLVFYYRSGRFIVLGHDKYNYGEMRKDISERFESPWKTNGAELYLDAGYIYMDPKESSRSADVVLNMLTSALGKAESTVDDLIILGEQEFRDNAKETEAKRSLEYAIDHNLVEVYLQPIIDSITKKVIGAEALARIKDPMGKIISPSIFIPLAEKSGQIVELGEQVFEKVCRFINENDIDKMGLKWINVNLSPIQFMRTDIGEKLLSIMKKYDVSPEKIHFEITEEIMVEEAILNKQIELLQDSGLYFVLDDYGKGYSNLYRVKKCPFINIKLDMSLVWEYMRDPDVMLPNMINTFKSMGFSITAEGIEDEKMDEEMSKVGCDYLQGFYFCKPITMDEFVAKYS